MTVSLIGLPAALSIAIIATLGYLMSRRVTIVAAQENAARQEMKQAQAVLAQLAAISQQMRKSLAQHHSTVMQFKSRLDQYQVQNDSVSLQEMSLEADRLIAPTQELVATIAQAYEGIRQTQQLSANKNRHDSLTGVGDRASLMQNIEIMLGLRNKCAVPFSIAMFDIDCFGAFNKRSGREIGDQTLCTLAGILDSRSRTSDQVARVDSNRFVVMLPGTDASGAETFVRRMQPYLDAGLPIACSVGVTEAKEDDTVATLLTRCQQVMQQTRVPTKSNLRVHAGENITRTGGQRVAEGVGEKVGR